MAYKTKFLHFTTKSSYNTERNKNTGDALKVFDAYISFVDEGPTIYVWGKEYKCDISKKEVADEIRDLTEGWEYWISGINGDIEEIETELSKKPNLSNSAPKAPNGSTGSAGVSTEASRSDHVHPVQTNITGQAGTANALSSAKTFQLTGDVTGSISSNLQSGFTINTTLAFPVDVRLQFWPSEHGSGATNGNY